MSYSPKQWRAISYYLEKNNLRPELSAYPVIRFTDKITRELGELHISTLRTKRKRVGQSSKKRRKRAGQQNKLTHQGSGGRYDNDLQERRTRNTRLWV